MLKKQNVSTVEWWKTATIYEVYLRSFQDSNGDGIGDLNGARQRLDYFQWLGVDAIWVTPFYPSPMADFGYDISNYSGVDEMFGSMNDFDTLLEETHQKGMKLIIDLVPNHSSDQHEWFKESSSSKNNPKRNWYIWKDPDENGNPPNNWLSVLGGSAWEWHEASGQFYYHAFLKEQPDLNFRNPEVISAMSEVLRFWLEKGVDGIRVDAIWHLIKDDKLRNNPLNPAYKDEMPDCDRLLQIYSCDQPEVHEVITRLRKVLEEYEDRIMIGEIYLPTTKLKAYYGQEGNGLHLPSNFQLMFHPWEGDKIGIGIDEYEASLADYCWPNWVIGNHDRPRLINRVGDKQLKAAAILLLTLRGTPTLYYGDEIGMRQVPIPEDEVQDPQGKNMPGKNLSRDPQRTPMQWDASSNAGFSTVKPWLRIDDNYTNSNVDIQKNDAGSLLNFYRKLIAFRKENPALQLGNYYPVYAEKKSLAFLRTLEDHPGFLVALNLGEEPVSIPLKEQWEGSIVFGTSDKRIQETVSNKISLDKNEALIIKIKMKGQ